MFSIPIIAIIGFIFSQGVAGVLGYFDQSIPALIVSIISIIAAIVMWIWYQKYYKKQKIETITSESIERDIKRKIRNKTILKYISIFFGFIFVIGVNSYIIWTITSDDNSSEIEPALAIDTEILPSDIFDANKEDVDISIIFHVKNVSDIPAYQNHFRFVCAPINEPVNISTSEGVYQDNPVFKDTLHQVQLTIHIKPIFKINNQTIIITKSSLKYSNKPDGDEWFYVDFWWALTVDFTNESIKMFAVDKETKAIFEQYFTNAFPDKWE